MHRSAKPVSSKPTILAATARDAGIEDSKEGNIADFGVVKAGKAASS
jgi:hypothetical protein